MTISETFKAEHPVIKTMTISATRGSREIEYKVEVYAQHDGFMVAYINGKITKVSGINGNYKATRMNGTRFTAVFEHGVEI